MPIRSRVGRSVWSRLAVAVCALAMVGVPWMVVPAGAVAAGNANFVGVWQASNGQVFTILSQDAGGACTGTAVYAMSACQVSGTGYTFTLTTGSYVSVNKGTITGNSLAGSFSDTNGTVLAYTATRAPSSPTVTDLSVRSGPARGGTSVVVTGSGFGRAGDKDIVAFVPKGGGSPVPAVNPVVVSDTEIDLTTPYMMAVVPANDALHTNVQVSTATSTPSAIDDSSKFNFPPTVLELGDSIASGEGTLYGYVYNAATGIWGGGNPNATWSGSHQLCHASPAAYGQLVSDSLGANFVQLACTGATYANGITTPETANTTVYQPAQFPGTDYDNAEPDAVVATFGADDVQFVAIVSACIQSALLDAPTALQCTATYPGPTVQADFFNDLPTLSASYGTLASNIEARGKAASPQRVPKIIFTDYMDPFPPSGGCADTWPMTDDQVAYLNTLMGKLNDTIKAAVTALAAADSNVGFADISQAIVGHTWCTTDPWDYGLSIITQGGQISGLLAASPKSQAPFHPTPAGHAAIAAMVAPVVGTMLGLTAVGGITGASSTGAGTGSGSGVTATPGGSVSAAASGYTPDETITITLHSDPVAVGKVTADGSGAVRATVIIPLGTSPGPHELLLTGATSGVTSTLPVLVSAPSTAPEFAAGSPPLTVAAGSRYTAYVGASGDPSPTYTLGSGSPGWLSLDPPFSGVISGTPPAGTTTFSYSVTASNGVGSAATIGPFTVTVAASQPWSAAQLALVALAGVLALVIVAMVARRRGGRPSSRRR